jgi:hypothetical protein
MPKIKHPYVTEQCSEFLIVNMRKEDRGSDPAFAVTHLGQVLALDVACMFQKSKNAKRASILIGLNSYNAYCIVYEFFSELIFGVTPKGNPLSLTWLHLLLTCITPPPSVSRRVIHMDLGDETGQNPDVQVILDHHGYVTQPTGIVSSFQNGAAKRPHQTIANATRYMLRSANIPPKYWEYSFYFFLWIHTVCLMAQIGILHTSRQHV